MAYLYLLIRQEKYLILLTFIFSLKAFPESELSINYDAIKLEICHNLEKRKSFPIIQINSRH